MRRRRFLDQLELVARAQAGDRAAVESLLVETEGMVRKMVGKMFRQCPGCEFEDLLQCGRLGILAAIETFDLSRGQRFSTHAGWQIRSQLSRARRLDSLIKLPTHITENAAGRAANPDPPRVCISLDETIATGKGGPYDAQVYLGDVLPADDDTEAEALSELGEEWADLREAVRHLPWRERDVIILRYGLDDGIQHTLRECGDLLGLSREGVRHREEKAFRHLREQLKGTR
jgi:RNA polymerase sigma factor (sigma-70 family)